MAKSVYIACGHGLSTNGSWDPGCTYTKNGTTYTEAELMLEITKSFVKYAKASGITVYTDATDGNQLNMTKTIAAANSKGVDAYVSVHCDYSLAPSGTYPYYCSGSTNGKKLATALNSAVTSAMGLSTRKIAASSSLGEVTNTNMPACIFETGSIKADLTLLRTKYDEYGKALAQGLCDYFGITFKSGTTTTTSTSTSTSSTFTIPSTPFKVQPKSNLIIREGYSLSSTKSDQICKKGNTYTITQVKKSGSTNRGKLKSGAGWITISEKYVEIVS